MELAREAMSCLTLSAHCASLVPVYIHLKYVHCRSHHDHFTSAQYAFSKKKAVV